MKNSLAGIEYVGIPGVSAECKHAIMRFIQYGDHITTAKVLSFENTHCFLLTINEDLVAVKSGFSSGYGGEGPQAFSYVIELLNAHGVEIKEYEVTEDFIERLDSSSLTTDDIDQLNSSLPIRPTRLYNYASTTLTWETEKKGELWKSFPMVIPFSIIDPRIFDLALSFSDSPDQSLTTGYRRLEDIVRKRTGSKEHGAGLFSEVFLGQKATLGWENLDISEQKGRGNLFTSVYMAYRNPRAHREPEQYHHEQLSEFLLLNQLFILEKEAYDLTKTAKKT